MFNGHVMAARVLGLVIVGGFISTGISLYLSSRSKKSKREIDDARSKFDDIVPYDFDCVDVESANDFPPDFRMIIHGGAGVVSKGIDSKPFFDALTRIMGEAYKFAKDGDRTITG